MNLAEIFNINEGVTWDSIEQDARDRGLVFNKPHLSLPITTIKIIKELAEEKLAIRPMSRQGYGYVLGAIINSPVKYKKEAEKLQTIMKDPKAYIDFLREKQRAEGFEWLTAENSNKIYKPAKYQLFLPRPKIFSKEYKNRNLVYDYDSNDKKLTESPPILTGKMPVSNTSGNKPNFAFWTSNLQNSTYNDGTSQKYYTSPWVNYVKNNGLDNWYNNIGYVYEIKPNARILDYHNDYDAYEIYYNYMKLYGPEKIPKTDNKDDIQYKYFPWHLIKNHWDGVYCNDDGRGYGFNDNPVQYGWDVPSCAWLDSSVLKFVREVKIEPYKFYDYD